MLKATVLEKIKNEISQASKIHVALSSAVSNMQIWKVLALTNAPTHKS